jgi:hypothetical protein
LSPVGFVTFANRVDAETAKQELTVRFSINKKKITNYKLI